MKAKQVHSAFVMLIVLAGLGIGVPSCRKKTITEEEARISIQEIASFAEVLKQEQYASEMLKQAEQFVATAPLSKIAKQTLLDTLREEAEIEKRILLIIGFLENERWYRDEASLKNAISATNGWEHFARTKVQAQQRMYRNYIDSVCDLLPLEGVRGAQDSMQRVLPMYKEYEEMLATDGSALFQSARSVYSFVLENFATMQDSRFGPSWASENLNAEFERLMTGLEEEAQRCDKRFAEFMVQRAELQQMADSAIQEALSGLAK